MFPFKISLLMVMALFTRRALGTDSGRWVYPAAQYIGQSDNSFGPKVPDPYRWLEDIRSNFQRPRPANYWLPITNREPQTNP